MSIYKNLENILSLEKKQSEFCEWLLETHEGVSIEEKERYLLYLVGYDSVKNKESLDKMLKINRPNTGHAHYIVEQLAEARDDKAAFFQELSKIILKTDSPMEVAQMALHADSPTEAALSFIQSEGEVYRLLELFRQKNTKAGNVPLENAVA